MTRYEYRVVPAPQRGLKAKGARTTEARFANALMALMNEMGAEGWEYLRADTLPCEERVGLTGRTTRFQNMLVFRRALEVPAEAWQRPAPVFSHDAAASARDASASEAPAEAPAEVSQGGAAEDATEDPVPAQPAVARLSVAQRLAATLTSRTREGVAPPLGEVEAKGGNAPPLGAARGQGLSRPEGRGVPAE